MAKLYVRQILRGKMTIEEVPERWKADVASLLDVDADAASAKEE